MFRRSIGLLAAMLGVATTAPGFGQSAEVVPAERFGKGFTDHKVPSPRFKQHKDRKLPRDVRDERAGSPRFGTGNKTSTMALNANVYGQQLHGPTGKHYISYAENDRREREYLPGTADYEARALADEARRA